MKIVVGAVVVLLLLIFMILGILWWKGCLGRRQSRENGNLCKSYVEIIRTVFTISYYGRKLEQCIENEKFYFSLSFPRWSAVQSTLSKETVGFLGSVHMIFSLVHDDLGHLVPILMIMSPWNHAKKSIYHFFFFFWIKNMHKVIFQKNNVFLA